MPGGAAQRRRRDLRHATQAVRERGVTPGAPPLRTSKRRTGLAQECRLFVGRRATENRIPVRESPEALDHGRVAQREVVIALAPGLAANARAQPHGLALALIRLVMFERQVRKRAVMAARQLRVPPGRDDAPCERQCLRIGGECARRATMNVARNWSRTTISASAPSGVAAQRSHAPSHAASSNAP